jgi:hypothetical protein
MRTNLWQYQSYLLRLWRESTNGEWRASLQNVSTGQCRYFASLPQLCSFLEETTRQPQRAWSDIEIPAENSHP